MTVKEELERQEHRNLNPLAAFADESRGHPRPDPEREQDVRTCYQRDTDRIVHSKSFRRLMHKTQVFLRPEGDHYRTRMTHTLEVARIARTITRALGLNEDLCEAHRHGPRPGPHPLRPCRRGGADQMPGQALPAPTNQSLRVVDVLENEGQD